jgi:hypothetical protein
MSSSVRQSVKDVSASYDALVDLFESIENFLGRLDIYTRIPITTAMTDIIIKIMVEVLATLALATRQVKQGRLSECCPRWCGTFAQRGTEKFIKKVLGENEIEAILQRLDRLTLDEARATGAQTLEVVYGLVQYRRLVMDGEEIVPSVLAARCWTLRSLDLDEKASTNSIRMALG